RGTHARPDHADGHALAGAGPPRAPRGRHRPRRHRRRGAAGGRPRRGRPLAGARRAPPPAHRSTRPPARPHRGHAAPTPSRDLDALVSWLPFDEALPALFQPPERLLHRLAWAGLDLGEVDTVATVRYKPRRRAVLRADGHIIKAYGRPHDYEAALAGAGLGARIVPTAPFALALP